MLAVGRCHEGSGRQSPAGKIVFTMHSIGARHLIGAIAFSLALPATAAAQDLSPISLRLPASTRALALGGAFPVSDRDSDGVFYNPAFAVGLRGFGAAVQWFGGEATLLTASAASEWWRGAIGVGVRSLIYAHPSAEPGVVEMTESALRQGGGTAAGENVVSVAYAHRLRGVRFGVTGHLLQQRHGEWRDETVAVDVTTAFNIAFVRLGVAARNAGPALQLNGTEAPLPASISLQAATLTRPVGPLDVAATGVLERRLDADRTLAGVGLEVSWWPISGRTFTLRAGHRAAVNGEGGASLGAGFTGDRLAIDYAWRDLAGGGTHRVGLRLR
jgi:hypothetical protein